MLYATPVIATGAFAIVIDNVVEVPKPPALLGVTVYTTAVAAVEDMVPDITP